jgi:ABC-type dipeptide/oligopeptide/nickel transport system ATPase subunit
VKSLFNAEQGYAFDLIADIEFPEEWQLGVLVGTSGSGKTSLGQEIFGKDKMIDLDAGWDSGKPDNRRHSGRL